MASIDQDLKDLSSKQPKTPISVVITTTSLTELQFDDSSQPVRLEPLDHLEGFYKVSLTGRQILALESRKDIESISLDQPLSAQQGE